MLFYITFKEKTLACGSQEVFGHSYVGHIRISLWVSGSSRPQVWPTFNPGDAWFILGDTFLYSSVAITPRNSIQSTIVMLSSEEAWDISPCVLPITPKYLQFTVDTFLRGLLVLFSSIPLPRICSLQYSHILKEIWDKFSLIYVYSYLVHLFPGTGISLTHF